MRKYKNIRYCGVKPNKMKCDKWEPQIISALMMSRNSLNSLSIALSTHHLAQKVSVRALSSFQTVLTLIEGKGQVCQSWPSAAGTIQYSYKARHTHFNWKRETQQDKANNFLWMIKLLMSLLGIMLWFSF